MTFVAFEADPAPFEFEPRSLALLMIDMQRDFLEKEGFGDRMGYDFKLLRLVIEPCRSVLEAARKAGILVIHTREGFRPNLDDASPSKLNRSYNGVGIGTPGPLGRALVRGEPGHDIIPELKPLPTETVVDKPGHGAFYATDLDLILRNRGINQLLVCGVTTENCIQSTLREAKDRGYPSLLLEDCTASYVPELYRASLLMLRSQGGLLGWVSNSHAVVRVLETLDSDPK
jgi:biuret amidohydrolase